jgi:hypothetical protein
MPTSKIHSVLSLIYTPSHVKQRINEHPLINPLIPFTRKAKTKVECTTTLTPRSSNEQQAEQLIVQTTKQNKMATDKSNTDQLPSNSQLTPRQLFEQSIKNGTDRPFSTYAEATAPRSKRVNTQRVAKTVSGQVNSDRSEGTSSTYTEATAPKGRRRSYFNSISLSSFLQGQLHSSSSIASPRQTPPPIARQNSTPPESRPYPRSRFRYPHHPEPPPRRCEPPAPQSDSMHNHTHHSLPSPPRPTLNNPKSLPSSIESSPTRARNEALDRLFFCPKYDNNNEVPVPPSSSDSDVDLGSYVVVDVQNGLLTAKANSSEFIPRSTTSPNAYTENHRLQPRADRVNENISPMARVMDARERDGLIQPYDDNGELESGRQYPEEYVGSYLRGMRNIDFDELRPCIELYLLSAGLLMMVGFVGAMVWAVFWR